MDIAVILKLHQLTNYTDIIIRIIRFYSKCLCRELKIIHQRLRKNIYIEYEEWLFLSHIDNYLMHYFTCGLARQLIDISHFLLDKPILCANIMSEYLIQQKSEQFLITSELIGNQYEIIEASILLYIRRREIISHRQYFNLCYLMEHSKKWDDIIMYYFCQTKYHVHLYRIFISLVCYAKKSIDNYINTLTSLITYGLFRDIGSSFYNYTLNNIGIFTMEEKNCINDIYKYFNVNLK